MNKKEKELLKTMEKYIIHETFTFTFIIIFQLMFFTISMVTHSLAILIMMFIYVALFPLKMNTFMKFYRIYKALKLQEEFNIRSVIGGDSCNGTR